MKDFRRFNSALIPGMAYTEPHTFEVAWSRASVLRDVVFNTIESGVVLGALWVGVMALQNDFLAILWLLGYLSLGVYLLTAFNLALVKLFSRWGVGASRRASFVFRTLSALASFGTPYILSGLTSDAIVKFLK